MENNCLISKPEITHRTSILCENKVSDFATKQGLITKICEMELNSISEGRIYQAQIILSPLSFNKDKIYGKAAHWALEVVYI